MNRKMKKHLKAVSLTGWIMICMCLTAVLNMNVLANDQKIADGSDLLTAEEETKLQEYLLDISDKYQCDVVAVTTNSFEGKDRWTYTDEYYFEHDYGYGDTVDGIILMVNLQEREFQYLTRGKAIEVFTDYGLEVIDKQVTPYLSDGEYYDAFKKYADLTEEFLEEAEKGQPFDVRHKYKEKMNPGMHIGISLGVGVLAALITSLILLGQLKTVRVKGQAQEYVRKGSFRVTGSRDLYLYRTVSKRRVEKNSGGGSSTRSSSGGGRAGGRGGSF